MKIPLSWLQEYIDIAIPSAEIAKILTLAGLEVDGIERSFLSFNGVVTALVRDTKKHPEADKLCVATVFDGTEEFQVVCGAPNCRPGLKTAFARVDATLTDPDGKTFKIKKSKLRGVESCGMLCAADELGLGNEDQGIIELADTVKLGVDVASLYGDEIFEISLTPNLGHCASVLGVARELCAATELPLKFTEPKVVEDDALPIGKEIAVSVVAGAACPKYACRLIKDVKVGPSPDWLKRRLEACGIRSINHVVDATNYVMLEYGHPLHAFDYDKIEGHHIVVREAQKGERLETLDGKMRVFEEGDLLICDKKKPIAIAGMMGGAESEVSENTQNVLIECAYFSPTGVRRTGKRLGIATEGLRRFERSTDPNALNSVLNRVCQLIQQISPCKLAKGISEVSERAFPHRQLFCRLGRINALLGTHLSASEVESIFTRLGFKAHLERGEQFTVTVPTYRNDLGGEIDLIEEVARIYGYGNISTSDCRYTASQIAHAPIFLFEKKITKRLIAEGLQEFLNCDLIGPSLLQVVGPSEASKSSWVQVLNPTSIEQSILRTSLLPGLLGVVKYNWDHQNHHIAGFELGRIHFKDQEGYREQSVVGIVLSGQSRPDHWERKPVDYDLYDIKGIVENLLTYLRVPDVSFKVGVFPSLHPGRQACVYSGELEIGSFGEVHPSVVRRLDVPKRIFYAEINLHDLFNKCPQRDLMEEICPFPASERDWTLTLKESVPIADLVQVIKKSASPLLEKVSVRDIYRSDKLGKGLKNVTLRLVYRDRLKTIEQGTVDVEHARVLASVIPDAL